MNRTLKLVLFAALAAAAGCRPAPPTTSSSMPEPDDRETAKARLKTIGRAMLGDEFGGAPPAASATLDGNGLSWRVQILPRLGKEGVELYAKFHPYESWDSPHNKTLIDQMPDLFASPSKAADKGMTYLRGFVGPAAFFRSNPLSGGDRPLDYRFTPFTPGKPPPAWKGPMVKTAAGRPLIDITDGTSSTFTAVEAAEPVIWTKPDELKYDGDGKTKAPLPKLGGVFVGGFHALLADGQVIWLADGFPDDTIRAGITIDGGEVVRLPSEAPPSKR